MSKATVVFVHGLFSSGSVWDDMIAQVEADPELIDAYEIERFTYDSRRFAVDPRKRVPRIGDVAARLRTFLESLRDAERLVLISHSQGGLVVQRYLASVLADGHGPALSRIRRIVMFACPNNGSEAFLLARRASWFWRHPQERELRPLNKQVIDAQRRIVRDVESALQVTATTCPIPLTAYAGESDNIVVPVTAQSVWRDVGVLPGDHSSIIRPPTADHPAFRAVQQHLLDALVESFPAPASDDLAGLAASDERRALSQLRSYPPVDIVFGEASVRMQVHYGPVEQLADVDIIVVSSNTYLAMSQFFKPSVSGRLRRASARKTEAGEIVQDIVHDEIVEWLRTNARYGLPVEGGTVAATSAGELRTRGIRRLYHAAIAEPIAETGQYRVHPNSVSRAVHACFELARSDRRQFKKADRAGSKKGDRGSPKKTEAAEKVRSICFPLLGAGRGALQPAESLRWMWESLAHELSTDPAWRVHLITWKPEQAREVRSLLERASTSPDPATAIHRST